MVWKELSQKQRNSMAQLFREIRNHSIKCLSYLCVQTTKHMSLFNCHSKNKAKTEEKVMKTYCEVNTCSVSAGNSTYNSWPPFPLRNFTYFKLCRTSYWQKPLPNNLFSTLIRHCLIHVSILWTGHAALIKNHGHNFLGMCVCLSLRLR